MKDCEDKNCPYKHLLHVHFKDDSLSVIEYPNSTVIMDHVRNTYTEISKVSLPIVHFALGEYEMNKDRHGSRQDSRAEKDTHA